MASAVQRSSLALGRAGCMAAHEACHRWPAHMVATASSEFEYVLTRQ